MPTGETRLPAWMPDLVVRDLRVGSDVFDIRFNRADNETEFEVLRGPKDRVARRAMTQWARDLMGMKPS